MKRQHHEIPTGSFEANLGKFAKGDLIRNIKDLTGALWRIEKIHDNGTMRLSLASYKTRPSDFYPRTCSVVLEAYSDWEKISK